MSNWLLIGLGNPGKRYEHTRHNLGFMVVRTWFDQCSAETVRWQTEADGRALVAQIALTPTTAVIGLLPQTNMNASGGAVAHYLKRYPMPTNRLLVVHDEIEVPWGTIRIKAGGSARGHNGVRSIHAALQTTEVARLLIGVGRPPENVPVDQYVLQPFTAAEQAASLQLCAEASQYLSRYINELSE